MSSVSNTLRVRIVGFLVVLSIMLIALPALMSKQDTSNHQTNDDKGEVISQNDVGLIDLDGADNTSLTVNNSFNQNTENNYESLLADNKEQSVDVLENPFANNTSNKVQNETENTSKKENIIKPTPPKTEVLVSNKPPKTEVLTSKNQVTEKESSPSYGTNVNKINGYYSIQVGVFSKESNAKALVEKLNKNNITSYTQHVSVNGKTLVRVYAGENKSKAPLIELQDKVNKIAGSKGTIVLVK